MDPCGQLGRLPWLQKQTINAPNLDVSLTFDGPEASCDVIGGRETVTTRPFYTAVLKIIIGLRKLLSI